MKRYEEAFKKQVVEEYEAMSPKPRQKDFADDHQIKLETFKTWLYDARKKKETFGIIELKQEQTQKEIATIEKKIPVHISLHNGANINVVLEESQFFALIWQRK